MTAAPLWTGPLETARLREMREQVRAQVDPEFGFWSPGPPPWTPPPADLRAAPLALLSTAALHHPDAEPFRTMHEPLGDTGFRLVEHDREALALDAPYVDPRHVGRDPESALPRRALALLHAHGSLPPPAPRHASFTAGIVRPMPGLAESAERLAPLFLADGVRSVVLAPT